MDVRIVYVDVHSVCYGARMAPPHFGDSKTQQLFEEGKKDGEDDFPGLDYDRALLLLDTLDSAPSLEALRQLRSVQLDSEGEEDEEEHEPDDDQGPPPAVTASRVRTHPGLLLQAELEAREITVPQLCLALKVRPSQIDAVLRGQSDITAEIAVRLGRYLGTGEELWMSMQVAHDVSFVKAALGDEITREVVPAAET